MFLDGGLKGSAQVTVNNSTNGSGLNLRNNNSTFSGTLIVNGNATGVATTESGLGVSGDTTGLANANITVNGTLELGDATPGLGWALKTPTLPALPSERKAHVAPAWWSGTLFPATRIGPLRSETIMEPAAFPA